MTATPSPTRLDPVELAAAVVTCLPDMTPARLRGLFIRWGGPIGAPRDWYCSVGFDQAQGQAWAGGYVGDGVTTTNLAGRTLADLITRRDTDLVALPWVNHHSRKWEPEPLRWLGINTMLRLPVGADRFEERTGKTEKWRSKILEHFIGH